VRNAVNFANRLSINQYSVRQLSLADLVVECQKQEVPYVGLWREKVSEAGGAPRARALVEDCGLKISSLCRGGFFPYENEAQRQKSIDENRRAIDEAAELATQLLVLVCGGVTSAGLSASRGMVAAGIAKLVPYAMERGVKLGIEPLHPMFAADRSVVTTLAEAQDLAAQFPPGIVGVVVDAYHVWWDAALERELLRAGDRILGYHVSDWIVPLPDVLNGRGLMGDGCIDFPTISGWIARVGYAGPIEVEIFNQELWRLPGRTAVERIKERFLKCVPSQPLSNR
jgi:sugar phosphate isomerase/epimerase